MPVMEVVLQQTFHEQISINRWNYIASGIPASVSLSFALTSALGAIPDTGVYPATGMMMRVAQIQSSNVAFNVITVKDVYSATDFYSTPFTTPLNGQLGSSDDMPPFVAYGFRTNRVRADIQRATKRFVGVLESGNNAGAVQAAIVSALENLSTAMSAVVTYDDEGNTLTFAPCVVSKEKYDPNPNDPTRNHVAYRYYGTVTEQMNHVAQGVEWQHYATIRSQASRQFGRGQ